MELYKLLRKLIVKQFDIIIKLLLMDFRRFFALVITEIILYSAHSVTDSICPGNFFNQRNRSNFQFSQAHLNLSFVLFVLPKYIEPSSISLVLSSMQADSPICFYLYLLPFLIFFEHPI